VVKSQFARVFASSDWRLFKEVAEINLAEATMLMKKSFPRVARRRQLGIGTELLFKASYLKLVMA